MLIVSFIDIQLPFWLDVEESAFGSFGDILMNYRSEVTLLECHYFITLNPLNQSEKIFEKD